MYKVHTCILLLHAIIHAAPYNSLHSYIPRTKCVHAQCLFFTRLHRWMNMLLQCTKTGNWNKSCQNYSKEHRLYTYSCMLVISLQIHNYTTWLASDFLTRIGLGAVLGLLLIVWREPALGFAHMIPHDFTCSHDPTDQSHGCLFTAIVRHVAVLSMLYQYFMKVQQFWFHWWIPLWFQRDCLHPLSYEGIAKHIQIKAKRHNHGIVPDKQVKYVNVHVARVAPHSGMCALEWAVARSFSTLDQAACVFIVY